MKVCSTSLIMVYVFCQVLFAVIAESSTVSEHRLYIPVLFLSTYSRLDNFCSFHMFASNHHSPVVFDPLFLSGI